ncbi:MAG: sodium/solute symporter [Ignavibacteria bacterium]|nr:sodium/solute symporter [Ignavibacteria bacterium]
MNVSFIDYAIIIFYLICIAFIGIRTAGRQRTIKDYFMGSKEIPWWAVCFSIVAAETSTLTFISIPGLAYLTNMNFLQLTFGYLFGRILIAFIFLPRFFKGEITTAYTFLESRFGNKTRTFASIVFLFTRVAADGVRLFATAIPLKLILNVSYIEAIILIAIIAFIYTFTGGLKAVIWVDVIQMFTYISGAVVAIFFLSNLIPVGLWNYLSISIDSGKFSIINFGFEKGIFDFFKQPYTLLGGILGGAFLSMASHGTDQLIVQRLLAVSSLKQSQKAIITSGIIIIFQFAIFLFVGILLFGYYGSLDIRPDVIFPKFIIEALPSGVIGLIIAGLLAAALSTLAGSISSLASSSMIDLYNPIFGGLKSDSQKLMIGKIFTAVWTLLLISSALFFMNSSQTVVELALSIASFTYGGLLGTFLLGFFNKKVKQKEALIAFSCGIIIMLVVISLKLVAWTWYTIIGVAVTILVGSVLSINSYKK